MNREQTLWTILTLMNGFLVVAVALLRRHRKKSLNKADVIDPANTDAINDLVKAIDEMKQVINRKPEAEPKGLKSYMGSIADQDRQDADQARVLYNAGWRISDVPGSLSCEGRYYEVSTNVLWHVRCLAKETRELKHSREQEAKGLVTAGWAPNPDKFNQITRLLATGEDQIQFVSSELYVAVQMEHARRYPKPSDYHLGTPGDVPAGPAIVNEKGQEVIKIKDGIMYVPEAVAPRIFDMSDTVFSEDIKAKLRAAYKGYDTANGPIFGIPDPRLDQLRRAANFKVKQAIRRKRSFLPVGDPLGRTAMGKVFTANVVSIDPQTGRNEAREVIAVRLHTTLKGKVGRNA